MKSLFCVWLFLGTQIEVNTLSFHTPSPHVPNPFTSHPCCPVTRTYLSTILMKLTICSFHLFHPSDNFHSNWTNISAPRTGKMKTATLCTAPDIFYNFYYVSIAHAPRKWHNVNNWVKSTETRTKFEISENLNHNLIWPII